MLKMTEEVTKLVDKMSGILSSLGVNEKEDDFKLIQPYENGQCITISVETDDEGLRHLKLDVDCDTYILDEIKSGLDIYTEEE